jgi:hypothetical protein
MLRIEVLNQDEPHAGVDGELLEKLGEGFESTR